MAYVRCGRPTLSRLLCWWRTLILLVALATLLILPAQAYADEPASYTVTYTAGEGGSGTAPAAQTGGIDDTITLPENTFVRPGYHFVGWRQTLLSTGREEFVNTAEGNILTGAKMQMWNGGEYAQPNSKSQVGRSATSWVCPWPSGSYRVRFAINGRTKDYDSAISGSMCYFQEGESYDLLIDVAEASTSRYVTNAFSISVTRAAGAQVSVAALDAARLGSVTLEAVWEPGETLHYLRNGTTLHVSNGPSGSLIGTYHQWSSGRIEPAEGYADIKKVIFDNVVTPGTTESPASLAELFKGYAALETIENADRLSLTNVGSLASMFEDCVSLTGLDLSAWDTTNIADLSSLFRDCAALVSLDLSGWYVQGTTTMSDLFAGCPSLVSVMLGENFSFGEQDGACVLPTPAGDAYTGDWVRATGGDPLPASELAATYDGASMAGEWVWEPVNYEVERGEDGAWDYPTVGLARFVAPAKGTYRLEAWGASGGREGYAALFGAQGGYSWCDVDLNKGEVVWVAVGGRGIYQNISELHVPVGGGWNGGGPAVKSKYSSLGAPGGGATSFASAPRGTGELASYGDTRAEVLLVAGGGGGGPYMTVEGVGVPMGGSGGGQRGANGYDTYSLSVGYFGYSGSGATQTEAGYDMRDSRKFGVGSFGQGGAAAAISEYYDYSGSGGGGGWYGGGGSERGGHGSAGGGSGRVGGQSCAFGSDGYTASGSAVVAGSSRVVTGASYAAVAVEDDGSVSDLDVPEGYVDVDGSATGHVGDGHARIRRVASTSYGIVFDANGGATGGTDAAALVVKVGQPLGTLPDATSSRGVFLGWYTRPQGGEQISARTVPTDNTTYYAHWGLYACMEEYAYLPSSIQRFVAPVDGSYRLEAWGASGGLNGSPRSIGSAGGYSWCDVSLKKDDVLYLAIGGRGVYAPITEVNVAVPGGFNGGGAAALGPSTQLGAPGGGATSIVSGLEGSGEEQGLLASYEQARDKVVLVAGGGGGGGYTSAFGGTGGVGGGQFGGAGQDQSYENYGRYSDWSATGATQTAGGCDDASDQAAATLGTFGHGGDAAAVSGFGYGGSGGGGGWFGGGGSIRGHGGGGGGSGHVGGSDGSFGEDGYTATGSFTISRDGGTETVVASGASYPPVVLDEQGQYETAVLPEGYIDIDDQAVAHNGDGHVRISRRVRASGTFTRGEAPAHHSSWGDTPATGTVIAAGEVVTLSGATEYGYEIYGWDVRDSSQAAVEAYVEEGGTCTFSMPLTDVTATPLVRLRTFSLALEANGGLGSMQPVQMTWNQALILPAATYARPYRRQLGWSVEGDAAVPDFADMGTVYNLR